jgi:hypothetical protein
MHKHNGTSLMVFTSKSYSILQYTYSLKFFPFPQIDEIYSFSPNLSYESRKNSQKSALQMSAEQWSIRLKLKYILED